LFERSLREKNFKPWSAANVAYSLIRPKSQIPNIRHDGTLTIGNFMLMMKKPQNLEFEPVHPKIVFLASVVHGISCISIIYNGHTSHSKNSYLSNLTQSYYGLIITKILGVQEVVIFKFFVIDSGESVLCI
jgi:hypothetical protein